MASNRVEVVNSLLETHDLVVNDLHLIAENGEMIEARRGVVEAW